MSTLCLKNGRVFDPINKIFNKNKDIYIENGKITNVSNGKISEIVE